MLTSVCVVCAVCGVCVVCGKRLCGVCGASSWLLVGGSPPAPRLFFCAALTVATCRLLLLMSAYGPALGRFGS